MQESEEAKKARFCGGIWDGGHDRQDFWVLEHFSPGAFVPLSLCFSSNKIKPCPSGEGFVLYPQRGSLADLGVREVIQPAAEKQCDFMASLKSPLASEAPC